MKIKLIDILNLLKEKKLSYEDAINVDIDINTYNKKYNAINLIYDEINEMDGKIIRTLTLESKVENNEASNNI